MYVAHDSIAIDPRPWAVPYSELLQDGESGLKMPYRFYVRSCQIQSIFLSSNLIVIRYKTWQITIKSQYLKANPKGVTSKHLDGYVHKIPDFTQHLTFLTIGMLRNLECEWVDKSNNIRNQCKFLRVRSCMSIVYQHRLLLVRVMAFLGRTQVVTHRSSVGWSEEMFCHHSKNLVSPQNEMKQWTYVSTKTL